LDLTHIYNPPKESVKLTIPERFQNVKPMSKDEIRAYFKALKDAGEDVSILPVPKFLEDEEPETYLPEHTKEQLEHQRRGEK